MKKFLLVLALLIPCSTSWAVWPYDSVCEITADAEDGNVGGSATLIAVSETQALILTCKHVVMHVDNHIMVYWAVTGERTIGRVVAVGTGDIAMCLCPRPKGLRPVPVRMPELSCGQFIVNVGFPDHQGVMEWQTGTTTGVDWNVLEYTCRPIPGMSGGATFDQYGNLVGVIQYYYRNGGGSTSSISMMDFVEQFVKTAEAAWTVPESQVTVDLESTPPEVNKIDVPEDWPGFQRYIAEMLGEDVPKVEAAPIPDVAEVSPAPTDKKKRYNKPPRRRRRFFRRRF